MSINAPSLASTHEIPEEPRTVKVTHVEGFGLFLEDGGYIPIGEIEAYHGYTGLDKFNFKLEEWYPVGSSVRVTTERREEVGDTGEYRVYCKFLGSGNIIDS